jgi:hypothetical protein
MNPSGPITPLQSAAGERRYRGEAVYIFAFDVAYELRVDLTRVSDELLNISKFFGDWHLARLYEHVAARFHLADWHRTVDEKLRNLDGLYQLLQHDYNNRWMLILEVTIVLLFVLDLVILVLGLKS